MGRNRSGFATTGGEAPASRRKSSRQPFHVWPADRAGPGMFSTFPERMSRLAKVRIGKRADRDGDKVGPQRGGPKDGPAAFRTKTEDHPSSAVGLPNELLGEAARGIDLRAREPGLNTKDASGSALALEAMAHRDENRLAPAAEPEQLASRSVIGLAFQREQCGLDAGCQASRAPHSALLGRSGGRLPRMHCLDNTPNGRRHRLRPVDLDIVAGAGNDRIDAPT